jgi:predicted nucleic acid-binding protein
MSYLLDTNVLSELARPNPAPQVSRWFASVPNDVLYISVLSMGEIRRGVERLPPSKRKEQLRLWLERDLLTWLGPRLLAIDPATADTWGRLQASTARTLPAIDSLLAATALHHHLRIVTRNTKDFELDGIETINPWLNDG